MGARMILGLLVMVMLGPLSAYAEDHQPSGQGTTRPPAQGTLPVGISRFLDEFFHLPEAFFHRHYAPALEAAIRANPVDLFSLGKSTALYMGMINDSQLEKIVEKALEKAAESGLSAEEKHFFDGVLWGSKILAEKLPQALRDVGERTANISSVPADFRRGFEEEWIRVLQSNQRFAELIRKAKAGDAQALSELKDRYDADVLGRFLGGQAESGNELLANDLAQVLASKSSDGESFLELQDKGLDGRRARLVLGNDPSQFARNLRHFIRGELQGEGVSGGFRSFQFAKTPPSDDDISAGRVLRLVPHQDSPPPPRLTTPDQKMAHLIKSIGCTGCHAPGSRLPLFNAAGELLEPAKRARLHEVLNGRNLSPGGQMERVISELRRQMSPEEKATIDAWAAAHGLGGSPEPPPAPDPSLPPIPENLTRAIEQGMFRGLVEPSQVATLMQMGIGPLHLWNVGPVRPLLKGAVDIGSPSGRSPLAGLTALESGPNAPSKKEEITIYCGCCELETCPNVLAALAILKQKGYSNIRVLNLPRSLDEDWSRHWDENGNPRR